jgi:hypothetical protein
LEELPPNMPEVVELLLSLLDEAAGLLPPNVELPAPVGLFPPTEELGGLLLVLGLLLALGLLLVLGLLPPNMEPPPDGLLDPPLGLLELDLPPFCAKAEVEKRKARDNAPISSFVIRMSDPSIVEDPTPAMSLNDLLLTKTTQCRSRRIIQSSLMRSACCAECILRFSSHIQSQVGNASSDDSETSLISAKLVVTALPGSDP